MNREEKIKALSKHFNCASVWDRDWVSYLDYFKVNGINDLSDKQIDIIYREEIDGSKERKKISI